jgi:hypothetical protein
VAAIDRLLVPHAGLHLAGNYLRGVSVRDCLTHGLELADRIARQIVQPGAAPHVGFSGSGTLVGTPN